MKTEFTKKEVGLAIAKILRDFYVNGEQLDITVGLTDEGEIDYQYNIHGGDVAVVYYNTEWGYTLGDDEYDDPDFWDKDGGLEYVAQAITETWPPKDDNGCGVDVNYSTINEHDFIEKYVDDFLEYGPVFYSSRTISTIQSDLGGIKAWFRISGKRKPAWLDMDLAEKIDSAVRSEVADRLKD